MIRFECGELLSQLSGSTAVTGSSDTLSDTYVALGLLCSTPCRCECQSASTGCPSVLRVLATCPFSAVSGAIRQPPLGRLSQCEDRGPPLERLLSCLLRAGCALLLSSTADTPCYYLCYVLAGDVWLEQLRVDAVSQSSRPPSTDEQQTVPATRAAEAATSLLSASSAACYSSSSRSSHQLRASRQGARAGAAATATVARPGRRVKQSTLLIRSFPLRHRSDPSAVIQPHAAATES